MIKVNCLSLKSITREYNYKLYYISSISFNFRPYSPIFDCILPALSTRVFGGVLDGKKDTSKKDRTTNTGRKYSACVGRPDFFERVFYSIKNSPFDNLWCTTMHYCSVDAFRCIKTVKDIIFI